MAKREALRELQSRLADRLQQARTEVRTASWLAVECADGSHRDGLNMEKLAINMWEGTQIRFGFSSPGLYPRGGPRRS